MNKGALVNNLIVEANTSILFIVAMIEFLRDCSCWVVSSSHGFSFNSATLGGYYPPRIGV